MTVKTLNRSILLSALLLLIAQALLAANPSTRTGAKTAFDPSTTFTVLFGGATPTDVGTAKVYYPNETFEWVGDRWVRRYPAVSPVGRSGHVMVYDDTLKQIIVFGGRGESGDLADTWAYANQRWTELTPASSPSPRSDAGAAYDPVRGRIVLFGGISVTISGKTITTNNLYDTWEFDGTTWTNMQGSGPEVLRPQLAYDEANSRMVMVGADKDQKTVMYTWDSAAHAWNQVTGQTLPPCASGSSLVYQKNEAQLLLVGGVCITATSSSSADEEAYASTGGDWTKLTISNTIGRATDFALSYDPVRDATILMGGTVAYGSPRNSTYVLKDGTWLVVDSGSVLPPPRSLAAVQADPVNGGVWMIGGLTDGLELADFWKNQNGSWQQLTMTNAPTCANPLAAYDTARNVLVVDCSGKEVHEWNGTEWKAFTDLKSGPITRRGASLVYDPTLKTIVLFGGYDGSTYRDDTWLWDGTKWTEQRNNRAPGRSLTSMWFDPVLKKTVMFGGLGRRDPQGRLERFNDMWSLGSNGWTEIKPSTLPGARYGASVAADTTANRTLLFGGLQLETDDKGLQHQLYSNDLWQWDGTNWTRLATSNTPPPRENAPFAYDASRNRFILFSGWAGYYLNDSWTLDPTTNSWSADVEPVGRHRATRK